MEWESPFQCVQIYEMQLQFRALGLIKPMIMATLEKILRSQVLQVLDVSLALGFDMLLLLHWHSIIHPSCVHSTIPQPIIIQRGQVLCPTRRKLTLRWWSTMLMKWEEGSGPKCVHPPISNWLVLHQTY